MSAQQIVYVLTYEGTILGVYAEHEDADNARRYNVHPTKQREASVYQAVVKPKGTRGF